jgi:hypothetical protein
MCIPKTKSRVATLPKKIWANQNFSPLSAALDPTV